MSARFYPTVGLPSPDGDADVTLPVAQADLPRLRGRLLAAGACVEDLCPTSLAFVDPDGVRVELVGR